MGYKDQVATMGSRVNSLVMNDEALHREIHQIVCSQICIRPGIEIGGIYLPENTPLYDLYYATWDQVYKEILMTAGCDTFHPGK